MIGVNPNFKEEVLFENANGQIIANTTNPARAHFYYKDSTGRIWQKFAFDKIAEKEFMIQTLTSYGFFYPSTASDFIAKDTKMAEEIYNVLVKKIG